MATRGYLSPDTTGQGREMYVAEADYGALARSERLRGEQAKSIFEGGQQAIAGYAQYQMNKAQEEVQGVMDEFVAQERNAVDLSIAKQEVAALEKDVSTQSMEGTPFSPPRIVANEQLAGLKKDVEKLQSAVDAGAMSPDQARDRILAIAKRATSHMPGLRKEINAMVNQTTGVSGFADDPFAARYEEKRELERARRKALIQEEAEVRRAQQQSQWKNAQDIIDYNPGEDVVIGKTNIQIAAILNGPDSPEKREIQKLMVSTANAKKVTELGRREDERLKNAQTKRSFDDMAADEVASGVVTKVNADIANDLIKKTPSLVEFEKLSDADRRSSKGITLLQQNKLDAESKVNARKAAAYAYIDSLPGMTASQKLKAKEKVEKSIETNVKPFLEDSKLLYESHKIYRDNDISDVELLSKRLANAKSFSALRKGNADDATYQAYLRGPGDATYEKAKAENPAQFAELDRNKAIFGPGQTANENALLGFERTIVGNQIITSSTAARDTGTHVPTPSNQSAPITNEAVANVGVRALNKGISDPASMTDQDLNELASWAAHVVGDGANGGAAGRRWNDNKAKYNSLVASLPQEKRAALQERMKLAIDSAMHSERIDQAGGRNFYFMNGSLQDGFPRDSNNEPVAHVIIGPENRGGGINFQIVKNPKYQGDAKFEDYAQKTIRPADIQMFRDKAAIIAEVTGVPLVDAQWALASSYNVYAQTGKWQTISSILSSAKDNPRELQAFKAGSSTLKMRLEEIPLAERSKLPHNNPALVEYAGQVESRNGLPPGLLVGVMTRGERSSSSLVESRDESGKYVGAKGIMQFMDKTRQAYPHDPKDPVQSIDAGGKFLKDLVKQYDGNVEAAVAHYNGGPNAGKAVLAGKEPPAKETRDYLKRVFGDGSVPKRVKIEKSVGGLVGTVVESQREGLEKLATDLGAADEAAAARYLQGKLDRGEALSMAEKVRVERMGLQKNEPAQTPAPEPNKPNNRTIEGKITPAPAPAPAAPVIKGQVEAGNIDLTKRPVVKNKDGTISTVRSMSVNIDGVEVLIPTVSEKGTIMTKERAIKEYKRTGKHLGKFETPEDATAYAEQLHKEQEKMYNDKKRGSKKK